MHQIVSLRLIMKLRSAIVFFICVFLVHAPVWSYGISVENTLPIQKESRLISSVLFTEENGIIPSANATAENIPTQLSGPSPLRRQNSTYYLLSYLPEHFRVQQCYFLQTLGCFASPPIYISICLLLI